MNLRPLLLSFALPFLLALPAQAQDATEYFHDGAQAYAHEEMAQAKQAVEQGLRVAPNDPKLLALKQKLEQQQQQQQQQQQNEQQQNQNQDEQQQNEQQQQNQQEQQQDEQQQGQQEEEQQEREEGEQEQEEQEGQQPEEQQEQEQQQEGTPQPEELSPEELNKLSKEQALRILQALEQDEEKLLREVLKPKSRPKRVEKDW